MKIFSVFCVAISNNPTVLSMDPVAMYLLFGLVQTLKTDSLWSENEKISLLSEKSQIFTDLSSDPLHMYFMFSVIATAHTDSE